MLAAGTAAQTGAAIFGIGLAVIAPALQDEYGLSIGEVGLLLAAPWIGGTLTLLPWGIAADRFGERAVLALGLGGSALALAAAAYAQTFADLVGLLVVAGAAGSSVQSASGRAVMQWFGPSERGLAFGLRQTAVPVGGVIGALVLPRLAESQGVGASFVFLGLFCIVTAAVGYAVVRELPSEGVEVGDVESTLRDRRLWVLCGGSGLYVTAQIVLFGFLVLYLHDERGYSTTAAAGVLAIAQVIAVFLRVGVGRWSDVLRSRIVPLRRVGIATTAALAAAAIVLGASDAVVVSLLVLATSLSAAWNGLSFVAAAEIAGAARSGAAIGFQQTVLSVAGVVVPPLFAATVDASSWRLGFAAAALAPVAGWAVLGRLPPQ